MGARPAANATPDGRYLFGTLAETVASRAKTTVVVVKTRQQLGLATFEELRGEEGSLPEADAYRSAAARSRPWWTAGSREHVPRQRVQRHPQAGGLKEKAGLTVSVGLPALNEEKTIGLVISASGER